jgi:hypothetical protein
LVIENSYHCTKVSGIIAANRNNDFGMWNLRNVKDNAFKYSYSGDEHDKDIAMAIYYAVDNGAKVSICPLKRIFFKKKWVSDAFKYAEQYDVLMVHCAGMIVLM